MGEQDVGLKNVLVHQIVEAKTCFSAGSKVRQHLAQRMSLDRDEVQGLGQVKPPGGTMVSQLLALPLSPGSGGSSPRPLCRGFPQVTVAI